MKKSEENVMRHHQMKKKKNLSNRNPRGRREKERGRSLFRIIIGENFPNLGRKNGQRN